MHTCAGCGRDLTPTEKIAEVAASVLYCLDCINLTTIERIAIEEDALVLANEPAQLELLAS